MRLFNAAGMLHCAPTFQKQKLDMYKQTLNFAALFLSLGLAMFTEAGDVTPWVATTAPGPYALLLHAQPNLRSPTQIDIAGIQITLGRGNHLQCAILPDTVLASTWLVPTNQVKAARLLTRQSPITLEWIDGGFQLPSVQDIDTQNAVEGVSLPYGRADALAVRVVTDHPLAANAGIRLVTGGETQSVSITRRDAIELIPVPGAREETELRVYGNALPNGSQITFQPLATNVLCYAHQDGIYSFAEYSANGERDPTAFVQGLRRGAPNILRAQNFYLGEPTGFQSLDDPIASDFQSNGMIQLGGFHARERQAHTHPPYQAWTARSEAQVRVRVPSGMAARIWVTLSPSPVAVTSRKVTLKVGGMEKTLQLTDQAMTTDFTCAPDATIEGIATLSIHADVWNPSEILASADSRTLGALVNRISVRYISH